MSDKSQWWQLPSNLGPLDRIIRIALAIAIIGLLTIRFESPWGLLGFLPLVTGILGSCPLYTELEVSTLGGPHRASHA
ncbi:MAG TPA: DUF2892 domain-containing protein [Thermoanaerobaculia bacterium]